MSQGALIRGALIRPRLQVADGTFEMLHLLEVHPEHETVVLGDLPPKGIDEFLPGCLQASLGEVDQPFGVGLSRDESAENRTTARAQEAAAQ